MERFRKNSDAIDIANLGIFYFLRVDILKTFGSKISRSSSGRLGQSRRFCAQARRTMFY